MIYIHMYIIISIYHPSSAQSLKIGMVLVASIFGNFMHNIGGLFTLLVLFKQL